MLVVAPASVVEAVLPNCVPTCVPGMLVVAPASVVSAPATPVPVMLVAPAGVAVLVGVVLCDFSSNHGLTGVVVLPNPASSTAPVVEAVSPNCVVPTCVPGMLVVAPASVVSAPATPVPVMLVAPAGVAVL